MKWVKIEKEYLHTEKTHFLLIHFSHFSIFHRKISKLSIKGQTLLSKHNDNTDIHYKHIIIIVTK